jgi:hypothetical protein
LEVHLGIVQNRFTTGDQVLKAAGSAAWVAASAVGAAAATFVSGGVALPVLIGAGVAGGGAGSLVAYGTEWLKGNGNSPEEWLHNGFKSQLFEEQKSTVMFESRPLSAFSEALRHQIFAMEETRQGKKGSPLFVDAPFLLWRTTRLEIVGGTQKCSIVKMRWSATGKQTDVAKYIFDKDAKPMEIVQVDNFKTGGKSK